MRTDADCQPAKMNFFKGSFVKPLDLAAPSLPALYRPAACPAQLCAPDGPPCTKCWATLVVSAAKARLLTEEKPELSDSAPRKKQKLSDVTENSDITEKPDFAPLRLDCVSQKCIHHYCASMGSGIRASPAPDVE